MNENIPPRPNQPDYKTLTKEWFIIDGEWLCPEPLAEKLTLWMNENNKGLSKLPRDQLKAFHDECGLEFIETYEK